MSPTAAGEDPPSKPQAVQRPAARCLTYKYMRLMSRDPTVQTWTKTALMCNPTGRITAPWRVPSGTRAPYPEDLPISKRAIWDAKSEAEVELATKLRALNEAFVPQTVRDDATLWEKWWLRCD